MQQIAIVSGKGGTGKTTLAGSLSFLFSNHVMADCDVDAPNLHLLMEPELLETFEFAGSKVANIDEKCIGCRICQDICRFDAIIPGSPFKIDTYACEGCGACVHACPTEAISLIDSKSGDFFLSQVDKLPLCHALLVPGEETSGGLIAEVRKLAIKTADEQEKDVVVIDASPGIGCAASSSITGVNYVIIVSEPTVSGIHDLERIADTARHFRREFGVVINKYDINLEKANEIVNWCDHNNIEIVGKIPFDPMVREAAMKAKPIVSFEESKATIAIKDIFYRLKERL